jgi:hypothetical protein
MSKRRVVALSVLLVGALALVLRQVSGLPILVSFLIVVGAVFANGLLATVEDDLPGGFNNPDGSATPPYVHKLRRVTIAVIATAALLAAAAFLVQRFSA